MKQIKLILLGLLVCGSTLTLASTEDEDSGDWLSYDNIISELSTSTATPKAEPESDDPFANILIHAGMGLSTSYIFLSPEKGPRAFGFLRGFEANFGIDLFSRHWMAEGSVRSFGSEELRKDTEVSLKEFDLKVVYHDSISKKLGYQFSTGMAARYLDYTYRGSLGAEAKSYSTPSAILSTGLKAKISKVVSLGTDISYRWALVEDTIDESAIDASLRLDAHF